MMRCDKCLAKRAELIADLEQRSLSEKREAIRTEMRRRIALGGECDAEIPLYLQVGRFEEERRLSVKVRFYRLLSGGCLECDSLPHRRWCHVRVQTHEEAHGLVCYGFDPKIVG